MTRLLPGRVLRGRLRAQRGASYLEYLIIVAAVVLVGVQAFTYFGAVVGSRVRSQATSQKRMGL